MQLAEPCFQSWWVQGLSCRGRAWDFATQPYGIQSHLPQHPPLFSFAVLQAKKKKKGHQGKAPGTSPDHTVSCWLDSLSLLCFGPLFYFKTSPHNLPHDGNGPQGKSLLPLPCPTLVLLCFFFLFLEFPTPHFLDFFCLFLNGSIPTCWPSCQGDICMQFKPLPNSLELVSLLTLWRKRVP